MQFRTYDLNILITHTATELNLKQAKQLKSNEKNYNLTTALFGIMTLLSFNTLKPYIYIYTPRKCGEQMCLLLKWICSTGQRKKQHSYKTIFTAESNSRRKEIILVDPKSRWEHKNSFSSENPKGEYTM